jgi:hypothetical protein
MRPPTPSNFSIELLRRLKNGWDFGSGGGASGMKVKVAKVRLFQQQQYARRIGDCDVCDERAPAFQVPGPDEDGAKRNREFNREAVGNKIALR